MLLGLPQAPLTLSFSRDEALDYFIKGSEPRMTWPLYNYYAESEKLEEETYQKPSMHTLLVPGKQILYLLLQMRWQYFPTAPPGSTFDFLHQCKLHRFCDKISFLPSLFHTNNFKYNVPIMQGESVSYQTQRWGAMLLYGVYFVGEKYIRGIH